MTKNPNPVDDRPFLMSIDDIFVAKGRGVVVIGKVQQGFAKSGDEVEIGYPGQPIIHTTIAGIPIHDPPKKREQGDLFFRGDDVDKIKLGMFIAAPGLLTQKT